MLKPDFALEALASRLGKLAHSPVVRVGGVIASACPSNYRVAGIQAHVRLGDVVVYDHGSSHGLGEVIAIDRSSAAVKFFDDSHAHGLGKAVWAEGHLRLAPDDCWLGRVIDALARPIDGGGVMKSGRFERNLDSVPPQAMRRQRIDTAVRTGVKAVDVFTPLCAGQRVGVFAGSGVGKSTLLGMLARSPGFDSAVVALVGERGREVGDFINDILGDGLKRSVVVVATGDESPMMRRLAPRTAMCVAEHLRDRGDRVLLIVDSITRYAHALREVGLASGEPPVARGYPPSVFTELPRLLERAGPGVTGSGSITAVISVLVDGDDQNEPVADAVRGIVDGHIVLSREVAGRGQFPAVDVLHSVSRLADRVWDSHQRALVGRLKAMLAEYSEARDLQMIGAYKSGNSSQTDRALQLTPRLNEFLSQRPDDRPIADSFAELTRYGF